MIIMRSVLKDPQVGRNAGKPPFRSEDPMTDLHPGKVFRFKQRQYLVVVSQQTTELLIADRTFVELALRCHRAGLLGKMDFEGYRSFTDSFFRYSRSLGDRLKPLDRFSGSQLNEIMGVMASFLTENPKKENLLFKADAPLPSKIQVPEMATTPRLRTQAINPTQH